MLVIRCTMNAVRNAVAAAWSIWPLLVSTWKWAVFRGRSKVCKDRIRLLPASEIRHWSFRCTFRCRSCLAVCRTPKRVLGTPQKLTIYRDHYRYCDVMWLQFGFTENHFFQLGDLNSSHHRAALLRMAASLRKQGELGDAHDYCTVSAWSRNLFRYLNTYIGKQKSDMVE